MISKGLEDIKKLLSAANGVAVARARYVTIGLVFRPLATNKATAPALIALPDASKFETTAVAGVLAFRDSQASVPSIGADFKL